MSTISIRAKDGSKVEFVDKIIGQGGMKDAYFSPDKSYVVVFFRNKLDYNAKDRLENIVGRYRESIFSQAGGEYWKQIYCWPDKIVEYNSKSGLVVPTYASHYFFEYGSKDGDKMNIKGKEKEGKWFASPFLKYGQLAKDERGDWFSYLRVCINISRGVRRMHAAGLAHSDLSYKNILIDPISANATIIDIDGLVVPGKFAPDVVGTPDFIAPEVVKTLQLDKNDPMRKLPSRLTDLHALGVLIYMYLLNRHPIKGKKIHDVDDSNRDEELAMGEGALFVEHSIIKENSYSVEWARRNAPVSRHKYLLPWEDLENLPYTTVGPYLSDCIKRAFEDGLHNPMQRPTADDWETALVKTTDLLIKCANVNCEQGWYPFDNSSIPRCPFCRTKFSGILPILNLYFNNKGTYKPENYRVLVYDGVRIYKWHENRKYFPNEKLNPEDKKSVARFQFNNGSWYLINERCDGMVDVTGGKREVKRQQIVPLRDGAQILLSKEDGGRLLQVQLVQC